ncbi:Chaperonin 60 subunit beta 4 [Senna tora]|uniref:Chaperonin 60 subunit beta 4 n=1 Tax=Senna tora TaxID=362788 RepID=A0A834SR24_9FABA|nr:Chaperonin 60 subunit beta 4 [Senna tora]
MTMVMGLSVLVILDLVVAGFSLMICFAIFAFVASILCSTAFFLNSKDLS